MIFDLGVYLAVVGLILLSFNILGVSDSAATPLATMFSPMASSIVTWN